MTQFAYDPYPAGKTVYQENKINEDNLHAWTRNHHFRTSYGCMFTDKPREPMSSSLPGYSGFIPGLKSRSEFGKSYSVIAKESLSKPDFGTNKFGLSSTGFNLKPGDLVDPYLTAWSHKYGASTMQKTHPSLNSNTWVSQTHASFKDPSKTTPPTYRRVSVDVVNKKRNTQLSGYATNCSSFDGKGLYPKEDQETIDARSRTEYRIRYNTEKPYHLNSTFHLTRKLKPLTNTFNLANTK